MQGAVIILLGSQISKMQEMADTERISNAKLSSLDPVVLVWDPTGHGAHEILRDRFGCMFLFRYQRSLISYNIQILHS